MGKYLISILLLTSFLATEATVRYVSKTGSSMVPFTSWETAAMGIQQCLNICQYGDTVYIGDGEYMIKYQGSLDCNHPYYQGGDGITLIGSGIDKCIIGNINEYDYDYRVLLKMGNNCKVMNITFKNNGYPHLTGLIIGENSFITNNVFRNFTDNELCISQNCFVKSNVFIGGVGIEINTWGYCEIVNNYFSKSSISPNYQSNSLIRNNIFDLISVAIFSNPFHQDNLIICNNLFIQSKSDIYGHGALFYVWPSKYILNNVAIGNLSFGNPGAFIADTSTVIKNNIAINGQKGFAPRVDLYGRISKFDNVQYNNSFNNWEANYVLSPDSTNLSVDPMFVNENPDSVDVHLQAFSPMIDMGDPTIKDLDGSRSDIGLYGGPYGEEYLYPDLAPKTPKNIKLEIAGNKAMLSWLPNGETDFNQYIVYKDSIKNFSIDSAKIYVKLKDTLVSMDTLILSGKNTYFKVTAVDKQGHASRPSEEVGFVVNDVNESIIKEESFVLYPAYPNPFNPSTRISFKMKDRGYVRLQVYSLQGELISTLIDKEQPAGYYETDFTGRNLNNSQIASGVYFYRLEIKNNNHQPVFIEMKKMIYLK